LGQSRRRCPAADFEHTRAAASQERIEHQVVHKAEHLDTAARQFNRERRGMPDALFAFAVERPDAVRPREKFFFRDVRLPRAIRFFPLLFVQDENHFDWGDDVRRGRGEPRAPRGAA